MNLHTAGPWSHRMHLSKCSAFVHDRIGRRVAAVSDVGGGRSAADRNARLIAAAPDLLEALQAIANPNSAGSVSGPEHLTRGRSSLGYVGEDTATTLLEKARAAIAKATGSDR